MYKLLAVDMDGTLLNSNRIISKVNKEAIKKAIGKGVKVVITSGRGLNGLDNFLNEVHLRGENQYLIANNGGTIYKTSDFEYIFELFQRLQFQLPLNIEFLYLGQNIM